MRPISDTIARLARLRAPHAGTQQRPADGHLSEMAEFGANPGALRAWTYLPSVLAPGAALVVVLHGCTQTASGYDHGAGWSELAEQHGFALLLPEQQRANNPNLCFNWFLPADTRRDSGEALSFARMVDRMVLDHGLDKRRVFVTGLSAGGAMASAMLATYPEKFAGGAIIAGLPHGVATTVPEAFDRMRGHAMPDAAALAALVRGASPHAGPWPTVSIWHGNADQTVDASNAQAIGAQWRGVHGLGTEPSRMETVDGHARRLWCDAAGRVLVDEYTIAGMGHGTPLDTAQAGVAAPFMLDVGISSTRHIAANWGIAPLGAVARPRVDTGAADIVLPRPPIPAPERPAGLQSSRVGRVIEDALRAAGLMR